MLIDCRQRIADQQFDDPPRWLPPEPEKAKVVLAMDDKKSHKVSSARSALLLCDFDICGHITITDNDDNSNGTDDDNSKNCNRTSNNIITIINRK